jgi:predicted nuclease of predicted toxin-antitoxin system
MKIVLDMNISSKWAELLAAKGHDTVHWSSIGAPGASDATIMAWAKDHDHVVMTSDLDFGEILAITNGALPSVIQLRDGRNDPVTMLPLVLNALAKCADALAKGALVTLDQHQNRLRMLHLAKSQ